MSYSQSYASRYHSITDEGYSAVARLTEQLIAEKRYLGDNEFPGTNVWEHIFGGPDPTNSEHPVLNDAFAAARQTPEYRNWLAQEMNDSMFDNSFGDVLERDATSFMCSAFGNYMAERVLRALGEQAAMDINAGTYTPGTE